MSVVISSAITPAQFTTITLAKPDELPQQIRGYLGGNGPVTFSFNASGIRSRLPELLAIEARRISGGQPRRTMGGVNDATAEAGAQLVTIAINEGTEKTGTGIITIPEASVGPGGWARQSVTMIFYPVDVLRFYGSSTVQEAP